MSACTTECNFSTTMQSDHNHAPDMKWRCVFMQKQSAYLSMFSVVVSSNCLGEPRMCQAERLHTNTLHADPIHMGSYWKNEQFCDN